MKVMQIKLPDRLHGRARMLAREEGMTVNQFLTTSVSHEVIRQETDDFFRKAAKRYSPKAFEEALAAVADADPLPEDRIG